MEMNPEKIKKLLEKWHLKTLTEGEKAVLDEWFDSMHFNVSELTQAEFLNEEFFKEKYEDILKRAARRQKPGVLFSFRRIAVAASLLIFVTMALVWFINHSKPRPEQLVKTEKQVESIDDILPGHQGAVLTLGNGERIDLDTAKVGHLADQGATAIANTDGLLAYNPKDDKAKEVLINTLSTPAGREYKVQLPDGSLVWLNASSSLTFPTEFSNRERRVQVRGEVYFEVTKVMREDGTRKPFIVEIQNGMAGSDEVKLEVLGTSFNVNAYPDEETVKTTLVEGSVRVHSGSKSDILTPSRQAVITKDGGISILSGINVDKEIAWRSGMFYFEHDNVKTILRQLSRWYDIDIKSSDKTGSRVFSGKISRSLKLADVMKIMDLSNIEYSIVDGKMIIGKIDIKK